ncbi:RRT14 [Candida pseudojiufengensis]|uniref:RRT14 n=1 Tax=Candida pseudojiufengensis TaxID=497109 RepID=UPI002224AFF7|nr:RRT14 [Candida pseudojiufengensis]KAI5959487.1 RRT14 [Candida pseudojiufengensis]
MSYTSNSSKHQAELTVNRLFSDILHTQPKTQKKSKRDQPLSTTQILTNQLNSQNHKISKTKSSTQKKKQKKKELEDKKFQKFVKYNIIINKTPEELTGEDKSYLKKLTKKNINLLNSYKIDDFEIETEMENVKSDLLQDLTPKSGKRLRKKNLNLTTNNNREKFINFDEKVKKGLISMPGLTPGLAPVDYDDEDESD